jgi:hypothetical protein
MKGSNKKYVFLFNDLLLVTELDLKESKQQGRFLCSIKMKNNNQMNLLLILQQEIPLNLVDSSSLSTPISYIFVHLLINFRIVRKS